jgi:tetratricopeptide (TPR) repeat protein
MTSVPPSPPAPAGPDRPRGSRRRAASGRRAALRRLDTATTAYLRAPDADTLQTFLRACGPALNDISSRPPDPQTAAEVVQQAALAYLHAHNHLGGTQYAEVAAGLLHTLIERAPTAEWRLGARADLATLEFGRYLDDGTSDRLQHCIDLYENALQECPAGYAHRPVLLNGLGNALVELSSHDSNRDLLDRAVRLHTEAVDEAGTDAPSRTALQVNLATALVTRYQRLGDLTDLMRANAIHHEVAATLDSDEQVGVARAELLWERYAIEDDPALLTDVAAILEQVVDTVPDTVPLWRTAAINLANARLERLWRFGDQDAVEPLLEAAARVVRPGTADWVRLRHVEGRQHWQAYLTSGNLRRLADALTSWQDAADGAPPDDPARAMLLNSVAVAVLQRAGHEMAPDTALATAEEAVAAARRAVDATAPRMASAAPAWNTLGHALALRHRRSRDLADICDAVEAWRTAVDLSPQGSRSRAGHLGGLAVGLRERAAAGPADAAAADLRKAAILHREAIALMAESTDLPGLLTNLGMTLHGLAAVTGEPAAYLEAREVFRQALAEGRETATGQALDAALAWQRLAADGMPVWSDIADACDGALDAIRRLLRSQVIRSDKETWLRTTVGITAWACRAHLELGQLGTAVLAVESGRGLILSEVLPPVGLQRLRPELFDRFRSATATVERLQRAPDLPTSSGTMRHARQPAG